MTDNDKNSGPAEAVKGVVEEVKGKAKEFVGTATGRGDLASEGEAQQDKAQAQRDAQNGRQQQRDSVPVSVRASSPGAAVGPSPAEIQARREALAKRLLGGQSVRPSATASATRLSCTIGPIAWRL